MNYEMNSVFFGYIWETSENKSLILKNSILDLFIMKWSMPKNINTRFLVIQSIDRKDYNLFLDSVFSAIDDREKKILRLNKIEKFNFDFLFIDFKDIINIYKVLKPEPGLKRFFLFCSLLQIASIQKQLKKYHVRVVTAHADMQPVENFIIQYFRERNINTVTLQHGLYIDYSLEPNINIVNYQNICSEYFLAWGEETKQLILKYHPKCKVVICGNPIDNKKQIIEADFFVVIFDQNPYEKYNHLLLQIAKEIGKKLKLSLKVKLHPQNIFKNYTISRDEVVKHDKIYNAKFAIGHTSTMLYELMKNNIPVYKYDTDIPANVIDKKFLFKNKDELIKKINNSDDMNINYQEAAKYYIQYSGNDAVKRYKEFYKKLIAN